MLPWYVTSLFYSFLLFFLDTSSVTLLISRWLTDADTGLCLLGLSGLKGSVSSGELAPISAGCLGAESVDGCKLSLVVD